MRPNVVGAIKLLAILIVLEAGLSTANSQLNSGRKGKVSRVLPKSVGQVFPKPQYQVSTQQQHYLDERAFSFQYAQGSVVCDILSAAFNRYYKIIFRPQNYKINPNGRQSVRRLMKNSLDAHFQAPNILKRVVVNIKNQCEDYPSLESDESYILQIAGDFANIDSKSLWGTIRGLETFSQLVVENTDGTFVVNDTYIEDYPRFNHRGILLDTSRHFIDAEIIKIHLEAMAANKMNVFHWHIVDDESFPYQSLTYPDLSDKGAYDPYYHVYTNEVIKDIIEFARLRGIRVVPEFDTPGHTLSWGKAVPILTPCYNGKTPNGQFGPIDPSNNFTYSFMKTFIKELAQVFPDDYLHLGGDEVDFSCWQSNPDITNFMQKMGFGSDYSKLEQYYEQNLLDIVSAVSPRTNYIIWQEVIDNDVKVKPETVVEVWKDPWPQEMATVTNLGYRTILSTCWYLNYISYGSDWTNYYTCEPLNFTGTVEQKNLVIGGEACMWGEYVDGSNVIQRTWPRASAVAERLWSAQDVTSLEDASKRIEEHRCRMIRRGISAEPFDGSGFCNYEITTN